MRRLALGVVSVVTALALTQAASATITIAFDYTYDTSGFFTPARRETLETAGTLVAHFADDLATIVPSGSNIWEMQFRRPDTNASVSVANPVVPADTLVVYVGARDLGGSLGIGGPGGYSVSGTTQAWIDTVAYRGEAGAAGPTPTDFGPWGGAVAFNSDPTYAWHFGLVGDLPASDQSDFLSVALHELTHVLGFGTTASWDTWVPGTAFTGSTSVAEYEGNVPLHSGLSHWAEGTLGKLDGTLQETAMDPSLLIGTRKRVTDLDLAALADVGWEVFPVSAAWTGTASTNWEAAANWSADWSPGPTSTVVFDSPSAHQPALVVGDAVGGLDFRTSGWTLGGSSTLRLGPAGVASAGPQPNTIAADLLATADAQWTVAAANTLSVTGTLGLGGHTLVKDGAGTLAVSGPQNHAAGSVLEVRAGTVGLDSDAGAAGTNLTLRVEGGAVRLGAAQHLAAIDIDTAAGGTIDLTTHNLILDYTGVASPFAEILGWVASGLHDGPAGYWDGPGIHSSTAAAAPLTAVGVIDNQDTEPGIGGLTSLEGEPVPAASVLAKYTWWGDANLDGVINSNDYDRIDANWLFYGNGQGTPPGGFRWAVGDFNYDGLINSNDYDKIDAAWLLSGGAALGGGTPVPTPEPATLALVALGGLALAARRRGR